MLSKGFFVKLRFADSRLFSHRTDQIGAERLFWAINSNNEPP